MIWFREISIYKNIPPLLYHQRKGLICCNDVAVDWAIRDGSVVKSACYTIGKSKVLASTATDNLSTVPCMPVTQELKETEARGSLWLVCGEPSWTPGSVRDSASNKRARVIDTLPVYNSILSSRIHILRHAHSHIYTHTPTYAQHPKCIYKKK